MLSRRLFNKISVPKRKFGSHGHGHGHSLEPHVPVFFDNLGKLFLVTTFFWIFYRFKKDKGQIFGLYKPWLHEHEHLHIEYSESEDDIGLPPTLVEHEHEDVDEHDE